MRHLAKDRCGYSGYACNKKDIQISTSFSIVYDPVPYDNVGTVDRPNHHNYLNIPLFVQGVISSTPYINLRKLSGTPAIVTGQCVQSFDPFTQQGFFQWFRPISKVSDFITYNGDYWQNLQDYSSDNTQRPGILLPKSKISAFNPISSVAINTGALASGNAAAAAGSYAKSVKSGCYAGFKIIAQKLRKNQISIGVQGGYAMVNMNSSGTPKKIYVAGLKQKVISGKEQIQAIQVYLVLTPRYKSGTQFIRRYVFIHKGAGKSETQDTQLELENNQRWALLGTVNAYNDQIDVVQSACSPVDMNQDWPQNTQPGKIYVHIYNSSTGKKQWVPVQDC